MRAVNQGNSKKSSVSSADAPWLRCVRILNLPTRQSQEGMSRKENKMDIHNTVKGRPLGANAKKHTWGPFGWAPNGGLEIVHWYILEADANLQFTCKQNELDGCEHNSS